MARDVLEAKLGKVTVGGLVSSSLVPRVETARLLPRKARVAEFGAFAGNAADPIACARSGAPVTDAREAWRRFHAAAGHWLPSLSAITSETTERRAS